MVFGGRVRDGFEDNEKFKVSSSEFVRRRLVCTPKELRHIAQRLCFFSRDWDGNLDLGSGSTNGGVAAAVRLAVASASAGVKAEATARRTGRKDESCQGAEAWVLQGVSVFTIVLRMVSSFRMQATIATLKSFPRAQSRS